MLNYRTWLYEVCRGFDHDPVNARQLPKSIGCSKNFTGKNCLDTREKVGTLKFLVTKVDPMSSFVFIQLEIWFLSPQRSQIYKTFCVIQI